MFRIVGNALPPRHSADNTLRCVEFILRNEPRLPDCERGWILNRLTEREEKARLVGMLGAAGETVVDIPFDAQAHFDAFLDPTGLPSVLRSAVKPTNFQQDPEIQEWILRHKSQLLIGLNAARNRALEIGRAHASWTLVLDGGVLLTPARWRAFRAAVAGNPDARFAIIPMQRLYSWPEADALCLHEHEDDTAAVPEVTLAEEPQIAFHRDSVEIFDERLRYGRRNKVELLSRLGLKGPWLETKGVDWETRNPLPAPHRGRFVMAGSVVRLPTDGEGKEAPAGRFSARFQGVATRCMEVDSRFAASRFKHARAFVTALPQSIPPRQSADLTAFAEQLLTEPDRLVTSKAAPAPGGSLQEYYSTAPYWTADGTRVDGILQTTESDDDPTSTRFDRKSLRMMGLRVYALALAGQVLGRRDMLAKSADLLKLWFVDPSSRMAPTAKYAQIIPDREGPNDVGLIEFRHLILLPYAARILADNGQLAGGDVAAMRKWFAEFVRDAQALGTMKPALGRRNNIATWSSALFCAAALFSGNHESAFQLARTASLRLGAQLGFLSIQPEECDRTRPLHYSLFNLSAWTYMSRLSAEFAIRLDRYKGSRGESIAEAVAFCSDNRRKFGDYAEAPAGFDEWIDLLASINAPAASGHVRIVRNADFGLPPILLL